MLASFTSMDAESDHPRFGNPDSVKRRHALERVPISGNRLSELNALKSLSLEPDSTIRRFRLIASGSKGGRAGVKP